MYYDLSPVDDFRPKGCIKWLGNLPQSVSIPKKKITSSNDGIKSGTSLLDRVLFIGEYTGMGTELHQEK